jgi:hypothetical protein
MENTFTVARVLFTKEVAGQRGAQHNVRFTTNETGETNVSGFFDTPLAAGQKIVGEIVQKPGTDRNGNSVIYNNFKPAGKRPSAVAGGMNPDQFTMLMRELHAINTNVLRVWSEIDPNKGLTSAGTRMPDFVARTPEETKVFNSPEVKESPSQDPDGFTDDDFPQF